MLVPGAADDRNSYAAFASSSPGNTQRVYSTVTVYPD